jgi:hypothetical protein
MIQVGEGQYIDVFLICLVFGLAFPAVCILDWWLVKTGQKSISIRTWIAEQAHPTLIVGIYTLGLFLGYICSPVFIVSAAILIATGHLVTSEGASAALVSKSAWLTHPLKRGCRNETSN